MNRKERRKAGIKEHEPVINIKRSDVEKIKQEAIIKASERAFILMLSISTMVVHDKFGKIMPKKGREQKFVDLCIETYEAFDQGYITFDDLKKCLAEEANVTFENGVIKCLAM